MEFICADISEFKKDEYEHCLSLMSKKRRIKIDSVTHKETKKMSVFAEWKAKCFIAEKLGKKMEEITFLYSEKGKPYIKDNPIYFSISHSGDFCAVAINDTPVGIDIEFQKPLNPALKCRICSDDDLEYFGDKSEEKLLEIWTAKEAYFKKIGTGITDLKAVNYCDISPKHFYMNSAVITVVF